MEILLSWFMTKDKTFVLIPRYMMTIIKILSRQMKLCKRIPETLHSSNKTLYVINLTIQVFTFVLLQLPLLIIIRSVRQANEVSSTQSQSMLLAIRHAVSNPISIAKLQKRNRPVVTTVVKFSPADKKIANLAAAVLANPFYKNLSDSWRTSKKTPWNLGMQPLFPPVTNWHLNTWRPW